MAQTLKPNGNANEGGALKHHNVKDLNKLVRECAAEAVRIKKARSELNEEMAEVRKRLRDADVLPKAFQDVVRIQEMEEKERSTYLDSLSVSASALGVGVQASLFVEDNIEAQQQAE